MPLTGAQLGYVGDSGASPASAVYALNEVTNIRSNVSWNWDAAMQIMQLA